MQNPTPQWKLPSQEEVEALASRAKNSPKKDFLVRNDLETLKSVAQTLVNQNNQAAERALQNGNDDDAHLIDHAANEQNIVDTYNFLLLRYEGILEETLAKKDYKLALYFDNYFVDFESNLEEAKSQKELRVSHHPYFIKMYRTTQDKLATLYKIYLDNTERLKKRYLKDQKVLIEIREEKKRYKVAYESVLDEFTTYATTFFEALQADEKERKTLYDKIETLQERFGI